MGGIDWKRIDWNRLLVIQLCLIAGLVLLGALGFLLAAISEAILVFALAGILALVLAPLVDWSARRGLPRSLAVAAVLLIAFALVIGLSLLIAVRLASQMTEIIAGIPGYAATLNLRLQELDLKLVGTPFEPAVAGMRAEVSGSLSGGAAAALRHFSDGLQTIVGGLGNTVIVITVAAMMLIAAPVLRRSALAALPSGSHATYEFIEEHVKQIVGGYVRGQLLIAGSFGLATTAGLYVLGVPYALLLGVLAALLSLVPMFGPVFSTVPALLVAAYRPFPTVVWVLVLFVVLLNVIEQFVQPRVSGKTLGLHPLAVMFALVAGLQLAGFWGAVFALPVAGLIWCFVVAIRDGIAASGRRTEATASPVPASDPETVPQG